MGFAKMLLAGSTFLDVRTEEVSKEETGLP